MKQDLSYYLERGTTSPERLAELEELFDQCAVQEVLDAVSDYVFVLNETRQVVFANASLLATLEHPDFSHVRGKKPGEVFRCENAECAVDGCGTSDYCVVCGAFQAMAKAEADEQGRYECRILRRTADDRIEALDLLIHCIPYLRNGERLLLLSAKDISAQKRKRNLERVFFHDVLNTISGLKGLVGFLRDGDGGDTKELAELAHAHFQFLQEEVVGQYDLLQAEAGDLLVQKASYDAGDLVRQAVDFFRYHSMAVGKGIETNIPDRKVPLRTDGKLVRRVIINMLKNALEASEKAQIVRVELLHEADEGDGGRVLFRVSNDAVIPEEHHAMIFHRSFSTKGEGRGLGTYSIRLLTEQHLRGTVRFTSAQGAGTIFTVALPVT